MGNDLGRAIELVNAVRALLLRRSVLRSKTAILVATSGGQDSTCLTAIIAQLLDQWSWPVGGVSCNHLWQRDSFYAVFHVSKVSFWMRRRLFCAIPPREIGSEARARGWRYNLICRVAQLYGYQAVCTGQTGSDRVETALFNSFRGSGSRGLSALSWNRFLVVPYPKRLYLSSFIGTTPGQQAFLFPLNRDHKRWPPPFLHRHEAFYKSSPGQHS
jgi:tRNA(Ile)-lysidine synthase TilS/MesJ